VLIINKADRTGVENTERALRGMLLLGHPVPRVFRESDHWQGLLIEEPPLEDALIWTPPILRTVATEGDGIPKLARAIEDHREHLEQSGELERRERARLKAELDGLLQDKLVARWRANVPASDYHSLLDSIVGRKISPHQAAEILLDGASLR
jgi:LAO/AO transport system kinase